MALLLSFDTATRHCAVVLSEGASVVAKREEGSEKLSHAEHLNVFVEAVLRDADRSLHDVAAVAVGIGPGSYTGLRIGLSAAKGFCFALDVPLIGISTLEVLTAQLLQRDAALDMRPGDRFQPMIDARRMEVFTCLFDRALKPLGATAPLILDEAWCEQQPHTQRTFVFGDGADKAAAVWIGHAGIEHVPGVVPSASGLAVCAQRAFASGSFSDLAYLVPDYGKEANVTQPKKRTGWSDAP